MADCMAAIDLKNPFVGAGGLLRMGGGRGVWSPPNNVCWAGCLKLSVSDCKSDHSQPGDSPSGLTWALHRRVFPCLTRISKKASVLHMCSCSPLRPGYLPLPLLCFPAPSPFPAAHHVPAPVPATTPRSSRLRKSQSIARGTAGAAHTSSPDPRH